MAGAHSEMSNETANPVEVRRKGPMEQLIETLAGGLGNSVAWMAESGVLFAIFAIIWVAFAGGLIFSHGSIDQAWQTVRGLPLIVQLIVWVVFLPVMIGLWVWETTWPLIMRLVLVAGVAGWNLFMFLPKALQAKP
jgi:ABC-type amino acid transport system permease subunit